MMAGRGLLIVEAEAHGSVFRFATTHLDSPGGNGEGLSHVRAFLSRVREAQAAQARPWLEREALCHATGKSLRGTRWCCSRTT